jgi:hypothetical protein
MQFSADGEPTDRFIEGKRRITARLTRFVPNPHFGRRHGELPELNRQKARRGNEFGNGNLTPVLRHVSQHASLSSEIGL